MTSEDLWKFDQFLHELGGLWSMSRFYGWLRWWHPEKRVIYSETLHILHYKCRLFRGCPLSKWNFNQHCFRISAHPHDQEHPFRNISIGVYLADGCITNLKHLVTGGSSLPSIRGKSPPLVHLGFRLEPPLVTGFDVKWLHSGRSFSRDTVFKSLNKATSRV